MSTATIESRLPSWRSKPNGYSNKLLAVYKSGDRLDDIKITNKKDHVILGRKKELCDAVLEHQSISRQHAVLFFGEMGAVYLMDLGKWRREDEKRTCLTVSQTDTSPSS